MKYTLRNHVTRARINVGTFGGHPYRSKPNLWFLIRKGHIEVNPQELLRILGRANGAILTDCGKGIRSC